MEPLGVQQEPGPPDRDEAVTELLKATVEMARKKGLLSGEQFSVDGTLIQALASHMSKRRKDASDDGRPPQNWHCEKRSNDTHESKIDPKPRLYRKSQAPTALPSYPRGVMTVNLPGLVVNLRASQSDGLAAREMAASIRDDVAVPGNRVTVGADKANDTRGFVKACSDRNVTPHLAQNTTRTGGSAIDGRTTRHTDYGVSLRKRKCIEQCFGWPLIGPTRQVMVRRMPKVDQL